MGHSRVDSSSIRLCVRLSAFSNELPESKCLYSALEEFLTTINLAMADVDATRESCHGRDLILFSDRERRVQLVWGLFQAGDSFK